MEKYFLCTHSHARLCTRIRVCVCVHNATKANDLCRLEGAVCTSRKNISLLGLLAGMYVQKILELRRLPLQNVEAIKPSATGFYPGFYDCDDDVDDDNDDITVLSTAVDVLLRRL